MKLEIGVNRRLSRILASRSSIVLPLDGALIDGPIGATHHMPDLLKPDLVAQIDCILGYIGLLKRLPPAVRNIPFIVNMSASTTIGQSTRKVRTGDVEQAIACGADGLCFQLHITDQFEFSMLEAVGQLIGEASRYGLPVLVTVYPRRIANGMVHDYSELKNEKPDDFVRLISHCVRAVVELGADIVKTTFPGDQQGVEAVVSAAMGTPILIAGGAHVTAEEAIDKAKISVRGGAQGVAFGRQIFLDPSPDIFVSRLRSGMDQALSR